MSFIRHVPDAGKGRPWVSALAAATILLALLAGPVAANQGPTGLSSPSVSPRSGDTRTVVRFSVTWQNHEGSTPSSVQVLVDGTAHAMAAGAGSPKAGLLFTYATKLGVGTHAIGFRAADDRKFLATLDAGTVSITAAPTPKPTPKPAPKPTPTPAPATGGGSGSATGSGSTTGSGGSGGATSGGSGGSGGQASAGSSKAAGSGAGATTADADAGPQRLPFSDLLPAGGAVISPPDAARPAAGGATHRQGEGASTIVPGLAGDGLPLVARLLPAVIGATAATTLLLAFMFFGRRRRDDEEQPGDDLLGRAAASGVAGIGPSGYAPVVVPEIPDEERDLPRWRRPSLMAARKSDPLRMATVDVKLTFDRGAVGPLDGHERRRIRYRLVHLLDGPDELRSSEIGMLDEGDEVQLLEKHGAYWRVLCPDGREGWLHQMTLGDKVGDEPSDEDDWDPSPSFGRGTGGAVEHGLVDQDVLQAYLEARGRA